MAAFDFASTSDDVYRFVVNGGAGGQQVVNVFDYVRSDASHIGGAVVAPVTGNGLAMLTAFRAAWRTNILPHLSGVYAVIRYEFYRYLQMSYRGVTPSGTWLHQFTFRDPAVIAGVPVTDDGGVILGDSLPTFNAYSVRKIGTDALRTSRGSARIGPVPEAYTTFQDVETVEYAALQAALTAFLAAPISVDVASTANAQMAVLSPTTFLRSQTWSNGATGSVPWTASAGGGTQTHDIWVHVQQLYLNRHIGRQVSRQIRRDFA